LEFEEAALHAVADRAIARGTGARGLRAILEEALLGIMYELPSRKDIAKVVVGGDAISGGEPVIVPREITPRRRRAAGGSGSEKSA
jgi:ATP-dependent Clp protease ATP-binding subunit ClpX